MQYSNPCSAEGSVAPSSKSWRPLGFLLTLATFWVVTPARAGTLELSFELPIAAKVVIEFGDESAPAEERVRVEETIPFKIALEQRGQAGDGDKERRANAYSLLITLPDQKKLRGYLNVYEVEMSMAEELAVKRFEITHDKILKAKQGASITLTGTTTQGRTLYDVVLGIDTSN